MDAVLEAKSRETLGKNAARRLRRTGWIPAVLYGGASNGRPAARPIMVDPRALWRILHSQSGVNTIIQLTVDGTERAQVMVKQYQVDPVTSRLLHADFYRVAMDKRMRVTVPIVVRGEARGVKVQGGLLDFVHREIDVECLPGDIPEHIEVDVSELAIGQAVRVKDLPPHPRWKPVSDPDLMLVHVIPPKVEAAAEAAPAAPAAPAEPEVIKKGKAEKPEAEDEA
jgi:large subunit ribosomal protein L25